MTTRLCLSPLLALAIALPFSGSTVSAEPEAAGPKNVVLTFTLGRTAEAKEVVQKTYDVEVPAQGQARMSTGSRLPLPAVVANDGEEGRPVTSFTYQNVGFTAELETRELADGGIALAGLIEDSSVSGPSGAQPPIIQSFSQRIDATLELGKPVRLCRIEEAGVGSLYVDVVANLPGRTAKRR